MKKNDGIAVILVTLIAFFLVFECKPKETIFKATIGVTYSNGDVEVMTLTRHITSNAPNNPCRLENGCLVYQSNRNVADMEMVACGVRSIVIQSYSQYEVE